MRLHEAIKNISSVAIVGASPIEGKVGNTILGNLIAWGFKGEIFPVNPKYSEIYGIKTYATVSELPRVPDVVVVAVPPSEVANVLKDSAAKGSKLVVLITSEFEGDLSSFSEPVEKGVLRIVGPNSAGISISKFSLHASIEILPEKGNVGVIAQSGAVGGVIISHLSELSSGISFFLSLGNSMDISVEDGLEYALHDSSTESVIAYIEWLKNGKAFLELGSMLRKEGKPLCVIKGGRGESSEKAARSHTGGIATDYSIFQAAVRQIGGYLASDIDEAVEVCEVLRRIGERKFERPIIVTNSGGVGVISLSIMDELGIKVKEPKNLDILPEKFRKRIKLGNPLDLGGDASIEDVLEVLKRKELREEYDIAALIYVPTAAETPERISEAIDDASNSFTLPTIGLFAGAGSREVTKRASRFIPVVSSPSNLARTLYALKYVGLS